LDAIADVRAEPSRFLIDLSTSSLPSGSAIRHRSSDVSRSRPPAAIWRDASVRGPTVQSQDARHDADDRDARH
jgi:hypothetical protein